MARGQHPAHRFPGALGAGYPVHRVVLRRNWTNDHQAKFMDWEAACGAKGTSDGHNSGKDPFRARQAELCKAGCWS